jgi:hypothetical protein
MSQSSPLVGLFRRINDSHDPLGAGMDMHMLNPDRLLVATAVLIEALDQLKLKAEHVPIAGDAERPMSTTWRMVPGTTIWQ